MNNFTLLLRNIFGNNLLGKYNKINCKFNRISNKSSWNNNGHKGNARDIFLPRVKTRIGVLGNYCTDDSERSNGFHPECEQAINQQILAEFNAAYAYLSMACYFGRSDVALPGCHGFFIKMHEEEMGHAHKFIRYQNMRGGKVVLCPIKCANCYEWNIKKAFEVALEMEKLIKEKLIEVNNIGEKHNDLNLMDMIVTDFIEEQERSINEFTRLLTRYYSMSGCGKCGCSDYLFDKHIHSSFVKKVENEDIYKLDEKYK